VRFVVSFVLLCAAVALAGCDKKGPPAAKRVRVTGSVTLDGKALTVGNVAFDAENGEPPAVFSVVDGKYEGVAAVGKNKVRIAATRKISMKEKMKMDGPGYDEMVEENLLPARYADGTLLREVLESGDNKFDFELKSK
jgi:hypothetical protein